MTEVTPQHVLALRRSSVKRRVIGALVRHGPTYVTELQRLCAASYGAILGALEGDGVKYSHELSLQTLGLVRRVQEGVPCLEVTPLGASAFQEALVRRPSGRY